MSILTTTFGKRAARVLAPLLVTTALVGCNTATNPARPSEPPTAEQRAQQQARRAAMNAEMQRVESALPAATKSRSLSACHEFNIIDTVDTGRGIYHFGREGCVWSDVNGSPLATKNYNLSNPADAEDYAGDYNRAVRNAERYNYVENRNGRSTSNKIRDIERSIDRLERIFRR